MNNIYIYIYIYITTSNNNTTDNYILRRGLSSARFTAIDVSSIFRFFPILHVLQSFIVIDVFGISTFMHFSNPYIFVSSPKARASTTIFILRIVRPRIFESKF